MRFKVALPIKFQLTEERNGGRLGGRFGRAMPGIEVYHSTHTPLIRSMAIPHGEAAGTFSLVVYPVSARYHMPYLDNNIY